MSQIKNERASAQAFSSFRRRRSSTITMRRPRRIRHSDIPQVQKLVNIQTKKLFGDVNVGSVLCKNCMSLVLEGDESTIAAAVCLNNYPNVPSIPPWDWESWVSKIYKMMSVNSNNSLWVHLAVFDVRYTFTFLPAMLSYIFEKRSYIKHVLFVVPPYCKYIEWLEMRATQITPCGGHSDPQNVQTIYTCLRQHYVNNYKIRRAVVEDNDDLVPLIDGHSARLRDLYGEFYIAEIILSHQDSGRQLIVAEKDGYAIAVMCLNDTVNYNMLIESFMLEPFYGLKKLDHRDKGIVSELVQFHHLEDEDFSDEELFPVPIAAGKLFKDDVSIGPYSAQSDDFVLEIDFGDFLSIAASVCTRLETNKTFVLGALENESSICYLTYAEEDVRKLQGCSFVENAVNGEDSEERIGEKYPFHFGEENAFVVEIAAAQPKNQDALLMLLEASFQCFPEKDYCILCIPSDQRLFELLTKMFVRVTPRVTSNFPHELYVAHRSTVAGNVKLREAVPNDADRVRKLIKRMRASKDILRLFEESLGSSLRVKYQSYVTTCDGQIVGLAIVSEQKDVEYIKSHYQLHYVTDMTQHKQGCHGQLHHFVLSPIFQRHVRFLLVELHRLSDYSIVYYSVTPKYFHADSPVVANVIGELLPVIPSKIPEYPKMETDAWELPEVVGRVEMPFALYISTTSHCGLPRYEVNTKIVVVGASDVGVSFLISLLFSNNPDCRITYNNVTLVSTHGLCRYKSNRIRDILMPVTSEISGYTLALYSLKTYVNIIRGVMSAIDRKNKTITVNGTLVPYDLLILTCGLQFQMPERVSEQKAKIEFPKNVYVVNTDVDGDDVLQSLKRILQDITVMHSNIIVYGNEMEAYCCLAAMIEMGIPKSHLIFVLPKMKDEEHRTVFNDNDVRNAVHAVIESEDIAIYEDYEFTDWTFNDEGTAVTHVSFESWTRLINLECLAMFAYTKRVISRRTFLAINMASLVFDGALVIEPDFRTNDPDIYAAGTITKYPRRYYADHMRHKYFNRYEIGSSLAGIITKRLMPQVHLHLYTDFFSHCADRNKLLVPNYHMPLMLYSQLPGNLKYMHVRKPGLVVPVEVSAMSDDYGQILTSGNPFILNTQGYFRLHLNQHNAVETITCLSKNEIERVNLTHLWGKHERLLNNLVRRFEMILIRDLFAYFRQPWTYALYHDGFEKFYDESMEVLTSRAEKDGASPIEDLIKMFKTTRALTKEQFDEVESKFVDSDYQKEIEHKFYDFLTENLLYLPMYAHPVTVNMILGAYDQSPLFQPM